MKLLPQLPLNSIDTSGYKVVDLEAEQWTKSLQEMDRNGIPGGHGYWKSICGSQDPVSSSEPTFPDEKTMVLEFQHTNMINICPASKFSPSF